MKIDFAGDSGGSTSNSSDVNLIHFVLLTEGCVSYVLSHTSPRDACRASLISKGVKYFANSDAVWVRFLPSDYEEIISRSVSPVNYSSKKELYFRLCDSPILLDDGNLKCIRNEESFQKLIQRQFVRDAYYKVPNPYLVYEIGPLSCGLDFPAKTSVRHVDGTIDADDDVAMTDVYLNSPDTRTEMIRRVPKRRADGLMEIELGKFYNDKMDGEIDIRFSETCKLHWKSGLIVEGIDIRPINEDE